MTPRRAEVLAWGLWGATLAMVAISFVITAGTAPRHAWSLEDSIVILPFLMFSTVGAIVAARRPDNRIGWLYLAIGAFGAFSGIAAAADRVTFPAAGLGRVALGVVLAAGNVTWAPAVGLLATLAILWFPDGRPPPGRWRFVELLTFVGIAGVAIASLLAPGRISGPGTPKNPIGIPGAGPALGITQSVFELAFFVAVGASIASFIVRFRRSRGVERQQLRWFVLGAFVVGIGIVSDTVIQIDSSVPFGLMASAVPVTAGIAITRYRLYDLDRLISRAVAYLAVSAVLVAVYAGIVVGIGAFTGATDSPVLIAGATLAVAALVRPVLHRVREAIDRRFYRRRYDAQRALEAFAASLRDEVALEQVRGLLLGAVNETMQPAQASVWLRSRAGARP